LKQLSDDFTRARGLIDSLKADVKGGSAIASKIHEEVVGHNKEASEESSIIEKSVKKIELESKLREDTNAEKLDDLLKLIKDLAKDLEKYARQRILGAAGVSKNEMQILLSDQVAVDVDAVWDELLAGHVVVGSTAAAITTLLTNVDTTVSSRAPSATALSTATWTAARAAYLDELAAANVPADLDAVKAETDQLPNWRIPDVYATAPVVDNVASVNATNLTAGSVTVTFLTGATRQKAILSCYLHAAAQAAGGHKVGITVQAQKAGGGYNAIATLTANPPLTIPDLDEAMAPFALEIDVTATVDTSAVQYDFRFVVDSDNAGSVNYTSNFGILMLYSM
jgi:hypothetical protein